MRVKIPGWLRRKPRPPAPPKPKLPKFPEELRAKRVCDLAIGEVGYIYHGHIRVLSDFTMQVNPVAEVSPHEQTYMVTFDTRITRVDGGVEIALPAKANKQTIETALAGAYTVVRLFRMMEGIEQEVAVTSVAGGSK